MNHTTNPTAVIYAALEGLQGTTHHLPPGTRQAVAEHLARVLPAVSSSAVVSADRATLLRDAADAIDAETRQLKADGVLEPDKFRPCRDASEQLRRLADEAQQPTDQDVVEAHRLALSFALDLGTGAPWDAIQERAEHLSRVAAEEQPAETQAPEPETEEQRVRAHVTTLHLIGEQLAGIESWMWEHLADVRDAEERPVVGEQPDTQTREA